MGQVKFKLEFKVVSIHPKLHDGSLGLERDKVGKVGFG